MIALGSVQFVLTVDLWGTHLLPFGFMYILGIQRRLLFVSMLLGRLCTEDDLKPISAIYCL